MWILFAKLGICSLPANPVLFIDFSKHFSQIDVTLEKDSPPTPSFDFGAISIYLSVRKLRNLSTALVILF